MRKIIFFFILLFILFNNNILIYANESNFGIYGFYLNSDLDTTLIHAFDDGYDITINITQSALNNLIIYNKDKIKFNIIPWSGITSEMFPFTLGPLTNIVNSKIITRENLKNINIFLSRNKSYLNKEILKVSCIHNEKPSIYLSFSCDLNTNKSSLYYICINEINQNISEAIYKILIYRYSRPKQFKEDYYWFKNDDIIY